MLNFCSSWADLEAAGIVGKFPGRSDLHSALWQIYAWLVAGWSAAEAERGAPGVPAAASGVAPPPSLAARRNGRASERPCPGGRGGGKGKGVHARAIQGFWTPCSSVSKHRFMVAGLRIYL